MNENKFLIYCDILGFENLPDNIGKEVGVDPPKIRIDFITAIQEQVTELQEHNKIEGLLYGNSDDWLFVVNDLNEAFYCINKLLNHNTGYDLLRHVPLVFAIDAQTYHDSAKLSGIGLVAEDATIKALKSDLVKSYSHWYKSENAGKSPTSTTILLSTTVYSELDHVDSKLCTPFSKKLDWESDDIVAGYIVEERLLRKWVSAMEFLELLDVPGSSIYKRIFDLCVQPAEYNNIFEELQNGNPIILTGPPEFGKTYMAIRLLWEFFSIDYKPVWVRGREPSQRTALRDALENIEASMGKRQIVYFEDPFGQYNYESRPSLERELGSILALSQREGSSKLIISSRTEIWKQFLNVSTLGKQPDQIIKEFIIDHTSYSDQNRRQLLINWANLSPCKWLLHTDLMEKVFEQLERFNKLPTPLSIRDFCLSTQDVDEEKLLLEWMDKKSEETSLSFAREIELLSKDKIVFLMLIFISSTFSLKFLEVFTDEIIKRQNIGNRWSLERLISWFKDDKITVTSQSVEFSHPSYAKAYSHLLADDGQPTRINEDVFVPMLQDLCEYDSQMPVVARVLFDEFDVIADDMKEELLVNLMKSDHAEVYRYIGAIMAGYNGFPNNLASDFGVRAAKYGEPGDYNIWHGLMRFLPDLDTDAKHSIIEVAKLPESVSAVLSGLIYASWMIADTEETANSNEEYASTQDKEFLECLYGFAVENPLGEAETSQALLALKIIKNPARRIQYLTRIASTGSSSMVARHIRDNYAEVEGTARIELLEKLVEKVPGCFDIPNAVLKNFDDASEREKQLVCDLSKINANALNVGMAIAANYSSLPDHLYRLMEDLYDENPNPNKKSLIKEFLKMLRDNSDEVDKTEFEERYQYHKLPKISLAYSYFLSFKIALDQKRIEAIRRASSRAVESLTKQQMDIR